MKDSLATMIKRLVVPAGELRIKEIDYRMYDMMQPHCGEAHEYRDIGGRNRYRCLHEVNHG